MHELFIDVWCVSVPGKAVGQPVYDVSRTGLMLESVGVLLAPTNTKSLRTPILPQHQTTPTQSPTATHTTTMPLQRKRGGEAGY